MKRFFIKLLVISLILGVGVVGGIYASSKIDFLNNIVNEITMGEDINIKDNILPESEEYENDLILINSVYDDFILDLRYATKDNITKTVLYDKNLAYLQKSTLEKLIQVNEELKTKGYRLKIWDAYRPLSVQKKLWAVCPNANFIANPFTTGSNHNRGASVDVTLVDLNGKEVEMPTGFDEFGTRCRRGYGWSDNIQANVDLLTDVMNKYGFEHIDSEWWHFDDTDADKYPIMDYDFRDLLKK